MHHQGMFSIEFVLLELSTQWFDIMVIPINKWEENGDNPQSSSNMSWRCCKIRRLSIDGISFSFKYFWIISL